MTRPPAGATAVAGEEGEKIKVLAKEKQTIAVGK